MNATLSMEKTSEDTTKGSERMMSMEDAMDHFFAGQSYEDRGDSWEAATHYVECAAIAEELGSFGDGTEDEGESLLRESQLHPRVLSSCAYNRLSGIYLDAAMGRSKQGELVGPMVAYAKEQAEKALWAWSQNLVAYVNLGNMERAEGRFDQALKYFARVVEIGTRRRQCKDRAHWVDRWVLEPERRCVSIALYMRALLLSQLGRHDDALRPLQTLRYRKRLSPMVWQLAARGRGHEGDSTMTTSSPLATHIEDAVPRRLGNVLRKAFAPGSRYWTETDYSTRGYFSFLYDPRRPPSNIVELLIRDHLLPLVERRDEVRYCEWWTHTRVCGRNLGHRMHFDTEETTVERTGRIVHPIISSVTYLSGGGHGGPTLLIDQRVDESEARGAALAYPQDNSFMMFPGDRLHGVLPGTEYDPSFFVRQRKRRRCQKSARRRPVKNRLTLMVGFWGTDADVKFKQRRRRLGPCSPFPRVTRNCQWPSDFDVAKVRASAATATEKRNERNHTFRRLPVRVVPNPIWESISQETTSLTIDEACRTVPDSIDQRFFVHDLGDFRERLVRTGSSN